MASTAAKRTANNKKKHRGPKTRDRLRLYEMSVQSPEFDVDFFDRAYRKKNGCLPLLLKEDFCGTAALCAEWVRTRAGNRAVGVDLDRPTLDWAEKHQVAPLGDQARRIQLIHSNVLEVRKPKVDVVAALNYSYFVFKHRAEM